MSKGFRVLLQILQVICLLGALVFLAASLLAHLVDLELPVIEATAPVESWAIGFGVLAVALSPALWALSRHGSAAPAPAPAGSLDRVPPAAGAQVPAQTSSVFEPMGSSQAPAPPASSYGQPSAGGFGSQPSPQAAESPWGSGR